MSSIARSEALHYHQDLPLPVEIRCIRSARRLRLRVDQGRRVLKLSGPLKMDRSRALAWAAEQREWVVAQVDALLPDEPFVSGAAIPLEGAETLLQWIEAAPRAPRLDSGQLVCGGPRSGFARRVELFLKRRALETLSRETREMADAVGVPVRSVTTGDADTRWGSCSSEGRIRYSWRLILAPPEARRYIVAHEVAHLVHLDHKEQFKRLERRLLGGDTAAARALLRRIGPRLKRVGRGS
jgi:predicted metal-dependent hydrolase